MCGVELCLNGVSKTGDRRTTGGRGGLGLRQSLSLSLCLCLSVSLSLSVSLLLSFPHSLSLSLSLSLSMLARVWRVDDVPVTLSQRGRALRLQSRSRMVL